MEVKLVSENQALDTEKGMMNKEETVSRKQNLSHQRKEGTVGINL